MPEISYRGIAVASAISRRSLLAARKSPQSAALSTLRNASTISGILIISSGSSAFTMP